MTSAGILDTCDVNYRCYPGCDRFRRTTDGNRYRQAIISSNEQLIPEPLTLAVAIIGAEPSRTRAYLGALESVIVHTGRLIDQDRVFTRLRLILSNPSLLPPGAILAIVKCIRRAFSLASGAVGHHDIVIRAPSTADLPAVLELEDYGFERLFVRSHSDSISFDKTLRFLRAVSGTRLKRIAVELMLAPRIETERLLERLVHLGPAQITLCAPESVLSSYADALEHCGTGKCEGYAMLGLNELVREGDPLASAFAGGTLEYSLCGLSEEPETERLGLGIGMISKLGDSFFVSEPDLRTFEATAAGWTRLISHAHHSTADDRVRRAMIHALIAKSRVDLGDVARRQQVSLADGFIHSVIEPILRACPAASLEHDCLNFETRSVPQLLEACSILNRYR